MDAVVNDDGCLEGPVKYAQILDEGAIDVGAVFAVEAIGEVFILWVENSDHFISIFALKS